MVGIKQLFALCQLTDSSTESKIKKVCSFLKDNEVRWQFYDGKLDAVLLDDEMSFYGPSGSLIIMKDNYNPYSRQEKIVFSKEDKQAALKKIVMAINLIEIKEERIIFIERYVLNKPINKIMDRHYISQYGYYKAIGRAKEQFCSLLRIRSEEK